jgi:hypothetical protein
MTSRKRSSRGGARRTKLPEWAKYLVKAQTSVRSDLRASQDLPTFLEGVSKLTPVQRRRVVEQARIMLERTYVHLPLKRAMHAVEPIQRLRLLELHLDRFEEDHLFQRELIDIFVSLRDLHTLYLLPRPYHGHAAYLPFLVEEYYEEADKPRYLVSHWIEPFTHTSLVRGSEVLHWNGVPTARAVEINAERHAGSNLEARRARGLDSLTIRVLATSLPPDERWVTVGYQTPGGFERESRFDWLVAPFSQLRITPAGPPDENPAVGLDIEGDLIRQVKRALFKPQTFRGPRADRELPSRRKGRAEVFPSYYPETFEARAIETDHGTFGHIRVRSFGERWVDEFIPEFRRLVEQLPASGLIIDVRDNGGGYVWCAEMLLQLLTPEAIEPQRAQFINTPETLALCKEHEDLRPWYDSIKQSLETGAVYSKGLPLTPTENCNLIGQVYHGPVVLITNAKCYSATDIFAAGFQDHGIGIIIGTDANTGAGGANVWQHRRHLVEVYQRDGSPFQALPQGADMTVAIRRTLRVGERWGTPVEDLGIVPDKRHYMTRNDLLNDNADLLNFAAEFLSQMPVRKLQVSVSDRDGGTLTLSVTVEKLRRLDVYVDGRPLTSQEVKDGTTEVRLSDVGPDAELIDVEGFYRGKLAAARRLWLASE